MSFGIPTIPDPAAGGTDEPDAELLRASYATLEALQKLAAFKPFTGWYVGQVTARVAELEREILEGDLPADEVMKKRVQRKEALRFVEMLKTEHARALQVLAQQQAAAAARQQVRETGPKMTTMPTPDFGTKAAEEPPTVEGMMKELDGMFSVFGGGGPAGQ